MTWKSLHDRPTHRRGEVLRTVIATAEDRRDGRAPMDVPGVAETFGDELDVVGALQLRWITRLGGRIERELADQPMVLDAAVVAAWAGLAAEMPGVRAILDHYRSEPLDEAMARAMRVSTAKERAMLAVLAGRSSGTDQAAARVGGELEQRARTAWADAGRPAPETDRHAPRHVAGPVGLVGRIRAVLAA